MEQQAKELAKNPSQIGVGFRRLKPLPGTKARKQVSPEAIPTGDADENKLRAPAEPVPEKVASLSSVQEHTKKKQVSITNQREVSSSHFRASSVLAAPHLFLPHPSYFFLRALPKRHVLGVYFSAS